MHSRPAVPESRYTGLELNSGAIAAAVGLGTRGIQGHDRSAQCSTPWQYDVVCSFQVLEHVSDIQGFLAGCLRALKTGGLLIICVPSFDSYLRYQTNALLNLPPHHLSHWSDQCLRRIAQFSRCD